MSTFCNHTGFIRGHILFSKLCLKLYTNIFSNHFDIRTIVITETAMVGLGIKAGQRLREGRFLNPNFFIPLGTLYRFFYQQLEVRVLCVLNLKLENAKSEKYITQNGAFFCNFFSVIFSCGGVISKQGLKRKLPQPSDNVKNK